MSSGPGQRDHRPIFILGCARSGTSLLQLMLRSHPRVAVPAETRFVVPAYTARCEFGDLAVMENRRALGDWITRDRSTKFRALGLDASEITDEIAAGPPTLGSAVGTVFGAYARRFGKPRWGDRRPSYVRYAGPLLRMFPDAQFVHLVRDGRDCVASLLETPWYDQDVHHAVSVWREAVDRGSRLGARLGPDGYYEMQYERLVTDPADELARLCAFLGEDFDPAMTQPDGPAERTVVTTTRVGSWAQRLHSWEISLAEAAFGERLAEFGYEPSGLPKPPASQLARFTKVNAHRRMAQRKEALRERWRRHHEPNPVECLLTGEPTVAARAESARAESGSTVAS